MSDVVSSVEFGIFRVDAGSGPLRRPRTNKDEHHAEAERKPERILRTVLTRPGVTPVAAAATPGGPRRAVHSGGGNQWQQQPAPAAGAAA